MFFYHEFISVSRWFYLDPGTGSLVLQVLMAALLAIGVAVKLFWSRIKMLFNRKDPDRIETNEDGH